MRTLHRRVVSAAEEQASRSAGWPAARGAPSDRVLDALASLGFLTLFVSLVLMAVPTQRRLTLRDIIGRTRLVTDLSGASTGSRTCA
jgi:hypothetical protein